RSDPTRNRQAPARADYPRSVPASALRASIASQHPAASLSHPAAPSLRGGMILRPGLPQSPSQD
ncbi:MAG: hypothetical protein AAB363_11880, partial [Planctomycetota bacterium]